MPRFTTILTPWQAACRAGFGWAIPNASADIGGGDTILACRNDNESRPFYIQKVMAGGATTAGEIVIHRITAAYTAAGTAIVPVNMRSGFKVSTSELEADGDETGNAQGDIVGKLAVVAGDLKQLDFDGGLILEPGQAIGLDSVTDVGVVWGCVWGYFEEEDAS